VALTETPKYVASATLTEPRWADTTVLSGDLAAAIGELTAKPAGELQVPGRAPAVRSRLKQVMDAAPTPPSASPANTTGTSENCGKSRRTHARRAIEDV
jgi:hypothetical protein